MVKYRRTDEFVRFCVNPYSSSAVKVNKQTLSGVYGSGARFSGSLSIFFNWVNEYVFGHELFNYTSITKKSFGRYDETTGLYDKESCLYTMQMNETDAALIYVKMPVVADGLRQVMPVFADTMQILSKYNITKAAQDQEILDNFRSAFDEYIWITLAFIIITFIVMVKVHVKFRNKHLRRYSIQKWTNLRAKSSRAKPQVHRRLYDDPRLKSMAPQLKQQGAQQIREQNEPEKDKLTFLKDNATYDVLTHMFQVETIDYDTISMRIVSIFLTMLSFYIITYFSNLMSTDMVLDEEPAIIRSYADLLSRKKIQMVFLEMHDDHKGFEYAPPGSVKHQLWQKSLQSVNGKRKDLFVKLDSASSMMGSSTTPIMATVNIDEKERIELVAMFSSVVASTARATSCFLKATFAYRNSKSDEIFAKMFKPVINVHSWIAVDPNEKEHLATSIFRESFRTPLSKRIEQRMALFFESGMLKYSLHKNHNTPAFSINEISAPDEFDVYRQCMSDNIQDNMNPSELSALKPEQFKSLFYACSGTVLLALVVLWYETWWGSN